MTPRNRAALGVVELALREVLHAIRDPLIDRATPLFFQALRRQRRALLAFGVSHLWLSESVRGMLQYIKIAAERDIAADRQPVWESSLPQQHDIDRALSTIPTLAEMTNAMAYKRLLTKTLVNGANQTGALVDMTFGENTAFVKQYIADHSLELIGKDIDQTTRDQMRDLLTRDVEANKPLSQIIRDIKQAGTFSRQRAETIAITEMGNAYSQGTLDAARKMGDDGMIMEKSWLAEEDCCDICDGNAEDGWIPIDENFSSGDDAPLGHPNCRCALLTQVAKEEE